MQERAELTRRALLEAAAHLFDERGYAETSMSDVGRLSGHTSGAIYFHYTGKERLARAVIEAQAAVWPVLIRQHTDVDAPALERLVGLSFAVARAFRDNVVVRAGARLWAERVVTGPAPPPPHLAWIEAARTLLDQAQRGGELAAHVDLARAARAIVCAFFGLHAVSDALRDRHLVESHLTDLWSLLLPSLQARPDAASTLARAQALLEVPESLGSR